MVVAIRKDEVRRQSSSADTIKDFGKAFLHSNLSDLKYKRVKKGSKDINELIQTSSSRIDSKKIRTKSRRRVFVSTMKFHRIFLKGKPYTSVVIYQSPCSNFCQTENNRLH